jgi:hypothetical protein
MCLVIPKLSQHRIGGLERPGRAPSVTALDVVRVLESVVFLTATGGFEPNFLYGYTGLCWTKDGLSEKFKPILPSRLKKLTIRNMNIQGRKYDLVVENSTIQRIGR